MTRSAIPLPAGSASLGRRRAHRTYLFEEVYWRIPEDDKTHRGVLVGVSGSGLAMVIERQDSPAPGTTIAPSRRQCATLWHRPAVITRVERVSDMLDMVAAEYLRDERGAEPDDAWEMVTMNGTHPDQMA